VFLRLAKRKHKHGVGRYAQIAEKYREGGKQKTRVIMHLGPVNNEADMERYISIFNQELQKTNITGTEMDKLIFDPPLDFGMIYAARKIVEDRGIMRSLSILGKYRETAFLMIVSRIIHPGSDISLQRFFRTIYYPWDTPRIGKDELYRTLDALIGFKDHIEMKIFNALKPDTSVVHYDLTSSYFEGKEDNDLVLFGYSRDKKRGKEQIVIGLVMADGIPIHHEVWPGNTVDPKTLESTISVLKERFHIKNAVFIADRAFGRSKSLDLLDQNQYITAAYRWDQPYRNILMETDFTDGQIMNDLIIKKVTISINDVLKDDSTEDQRKLAEKRRYIAVYNKKREELDLNELNDKIDIIKKKMSEIQDQKELKKSLGKLKSLVKFTKNGTDLNEKRINILKKLAGRFLIVTNTDLKGDEVVSAYKEQWQIERSFRTIKSFLEIRPVYHRKPERIKAHVFVCVLSLLLSRLMEKKLTESHLTAERTAEILCGIKAIPVKSPLNIVYRSESVEAERILNEMRIKQPDRILVGALPKSD
jgi:transposase